MCVVEKYSIGDIVMNADKKWGRAIQRIRSRIIAKVVGVPVGISKPSPVEGASLLSKTDKTLTCLDLFIGGHLFSYPACAKRFFIFINCFTIVILKAKGEMIFLNYKNKQGGGDAYTVSTFGDLPVSRRGRSNDRIGKVFKKIVASKLDSENGAAINCYAKFSPLRGS